jgi:hypothetical protein
MEGQLRYLPSAIRLLSDHRLYPSTLRRLLGLRPPRSNLDGNTPHTTPSFLLLRGQLISPRLENWVDRSKQRHRPLSTNNLTRPSDAVNRVIANLCPSFALPWHYRGSVFSLRA